MKFINKKEIIKDKHTLNNGKNEVPKVGLIDFLTLGISYLIKLMKQGRKDYKNFKKNEPQIINNCKKNNIDYVLNNKRDNIKDVNKGIGIYHDINDIKNQITKNQNDIVLKEELKNKQNKLDKLCKNNKTLNILINSNKDSCAIAQGTFHQGIFASHINKNGEKEFFLIDQGGRKVAGSGFPNDDELSKNGINIMKVSPTNGMCVATACAGLQEISNNGLDSFLDVYTTNIVSSKRNNIKLNGYNNFKPNQKNITNIINNQKRIERLDSGIANIKFNNLKYAMKEKANIDKTLKDNSKTANSSKMMITNISNSCDNVNINNDIKSIKAEHHKNSLSIQ